MSISAGWLILAVAAVRFVIAKSPKNFRLLLWFIVAMRLLMPFSIESIFSLIPSSETIPADIGLMAKPAIHTGVLALNSVVNPIIQQTSATDPTLLTSANPLQIWIAFFANIWLLGIFAFIIYMMISCLRLKKEIRNAVHFKGNIFVTDKIDSPFVFGFIRPCIYLPIHLEEQSLEYVITHETVHIRRKDNWWKILGFLIVSIHWFNPLVWFAYILFCKDIELACDETVIKEMDSEHKADYAKALLSCSIKPSKFSLTTAAFGEVGVKERIKSVMHYKKPAFWILIVTVLVCIGVAVCFLTNPVKSPNAPQVNSKNTGVITWFDTFSAEMSTTKNGLTSTADGGFKIQDFPDTIFYHDLEHIWTSQDDKTLVGGWPIVNAYFCDLTGDGLSEICATVSIGSGIIDSRIVVYDYAHGVWYELEAREKYDYFLRYNSEYNCLYAEQKEYSNQKQMAYGPLILENNQLKIAYDQTESSNAYIVETIDITFDAEAALDKYEEVVYKRHYKMSDGTWETDTHSYKYRLVVSGTASNGRRSRICLYKV